MRVRYSTGVLAFARFGADGAGASAMPLPMTATDPLVVSFACTY
jgi:hypothetical protein